MPFGYHGCYLRIDVSSGSVERVPLADAVLRQFIGGSGLGVAAAARRRLRAPRSRSIPAAPLVFAFSPLVGSPLTTSAKFAVVSKSPLTDRINDSLASSGFAVAGKSCGCDAIVIVGRAPELSVLIIDDGQVRVESAAECAGKTCQETEARLRSRLGANFRIASIGPAGENGGPLRHHLARRPPCRPRRQRRRAGREEHQGDRRARHAACRVGASARADRDQQGPVEAIVRSGDGEVPRARHRHQSADVQPLRRAADAELSERHVRRSARTSRRAAEHHAREDARQLRDVHDRLRAYLLDRRAGRRRARRVREPVRAWIALRRRRRRRRVARVTAMRRARPRHHQHRRDDRVCDGVRRARLARRAVADVRERRRAAACDRADWRRARASAICWPTAAVARRTRSGTTASRLRRRSRASRFPATSRGRCRRWRSGLPSARAAPITIAAAPTKWTSRTRSIAAT